MTEAVDELVQSTLASVGGFVAVLQAEGQAGLAARFRAIEKLLQDGASADAIAEFERGAYSGPGGLNDMYAVNQARFDAAWSQCALKLRALKRAVAE